MKHYLTAILKFGPRMNPRPRLSRRTIRIILFVACISALSTAALIGPRPAVANVTITPGTSFTVAVDGPENVSVDCAPGPGGTVRVTVDGTTTVTATLCSSVTSLQISASGEFDNTLSIANVTSAAFTSLTSTHLNGGGGNDLLIGSPLNDTMDGGGGDDTFIGNGGTDSIGGGVGGSVGDTILVPGTSGNDTINLALDGSGHLLATVNGTTITYQNFLGGPIATSGVEHILVQGLAGNDALTVDSTNGAIPVPINFDGGDNSDSLILTGGTATADSYTAGPLTDQGVSQLVIGGVTQTVSFNSVEPMTDLLAGPLTVNGTNGNNAINYTQGSGAGLGRVSIDGFETIEFTNKTSLTINGLAGDDVINLHNPTTPTGFTGSIAVNGGDPGASDTLIVNGIPGVLDNLRYLPTAVGAGTVVNDSQPQPQVTFTGIEILKAVVQQADGDGIRLDGTTGNDAVEFFHGLTSDSGSFVGTMDQNNATGVGPFTMTPMNFSGASPIANDTDVNFFNPGGTDSIVFNGTGNDDNIVVQNGQAGGTDFSNTVNGIMVSHLEVFNVASGLVRGLEGNDHITINPPAGPAAVTLRVEGGDSAGSGDTLIYNPPSNAVTTVDLRVGTINSTSSNPVTFTGIETVNLNSTGASSALTIEGSLGPQTLVYSPATSGTGTVSGFGPTVNFTGVGQPIQFNGHDPASSDTLVVTGRVNTADAITYTPVTATSGRVAITGLPTVNFGGIAHLVINGQNTGVGATGDSLTIDTVNLSLGQTEILTPGSKFDSGHVDFRDRPGGFDTSGVPVDFLALGVSGSLTFADSFGLSDNLIYNGTPLNDTFNVSAAGKVVLNDQIPVNVSGATMRTLTLAGLGGVNTFNVPGNHNLPGFGGSAGIFIQGGDDSVGIVNYNTIANAATTIDLRTNNLTSTGGTAVSVSGIQTINETSTGATSGLTIHGSTGPESVVYSPTGPPGPTAVGSGTVSGFGTTINFTGVGQSTTFVGHDPGVTDTLIANANGANLVLEPTAQNAGTLNYFGGAFPGITFSGIGHLTLQGTATNPFGIDGTTGDDQFIYTPGATPDTGTVVGTMNSGIAQFPLVPTTFIAAQQLGVIVFNTFGQQGGNDSFVFNGTPNDDQISVLNGVVFGGVTLNDTVNGALFAKLNLNNMAAGVTVEGNDGDDVFTHDGNVQVPLTYSGGNHAVGNTLNYNALANAATTIDFGATSVTSTGSGAVNFVGITTINETSSGVGQSLTVNGTSGGDNVTFIPTGTNAGTVTLAGLKPIVKFIGVPTLGLDGVDGNDFFNITPSSTVIVNVDGGNPTPPASPGDSINVNTAGTTGASQTNSSGPTGLSGSFTFSNRQTVNFQQIETLSQLAVTGRAFNAVEGVPFSNQIVGAFNAGAIPASNFTATINWGDGSASSTGVIVANGAAGAFNVQGGHTYTEEGSYNVVVQVTDGTTGTVQQATGTATVADAPLSIAPQAAGSSTTFTGAGGTNVAGGAFNAMSAFQAAIGGANNGGIASPQPNGFRTINWDGVGLTATDGPPANPFTNQVIVPNHVVGIPLNRFQERGMNFSEIYAVADDGFTSVNGGVGGQFPAFSPNKTFAMFNDNSIDFNFVLPSVHNTNVPIQAVTRGFGAIFLDVETPNATSIEYFNGTTSLGKFFVPVGASGQAQFFGVLFQNPVVTNVEITLGNATLFSFDGTNVTSGPADAPPGTDLAVTDDFVYPEPQAVSTGININAIAGAPFTARVASFTDADPNGQLSDYSVVIDWGDGTTSAGGVSPNAAQPESGTRMDTNASITPSVNGGWDVTGTHTYASAGTFTITTSIRDIGGSSISASSTATVTGQPSLSINNVTVTEGNSGTTNAQFTVTLSSASSQTVTVDYMTADGTATAPSDYDTQAGTLSFPPGVTSRTINIAVKGDTLPEPNETFFVNLLNPVNASISVAQGTGTINDDDENGFVQFSAPTATVAENGGSISLTVTRTGDTSGVTTVNFETSDGTAVQKSDYTFNSGTIQFNPGDTSKTITILLVDDVFVEGSETFKVILSNVSGNFVIGNPNQVTVTITDNDSVPPVTNPIDDATFFVRQHYLDFLGREPDPSGLAFWTGQITSCGANPSCIAAARVNVSAAFFLSIEYQETSGAVVRLQRGAFGKISADPALRVSYLQFMRDTRQVGAGVVVGQPGYLTLLEQNKQAYALQLVNSPAFLARFPIMPAANYVDALMASAGVTPTAAERTAAINAFGAGGTLGRVAALRSLADSNTMRQAEMIPSFVLAEFYGYLRRNPTDAPDFNDNGYQFWLAKLTAFNGDFVAAEMVKAFITSGEYRQRFGP